jgi:signal transduction histidine kinase
MGSWEWNLADDQVISTSENNRLFGRERDAPPYSHEASLQEIHPEDRERVKTIINRSVAEASTYSCDYRIRLPDGGERVIFEQADVTCDESGDPVRVTGITLDITERYRAQEQLRGAVREAEAASEAKSQFMANMSHELRTPLNAIIGYSEILKEDALERGETSFIPDLDKINTAGRHLLELINDVLDLSRIEAGRSEIFIETVALSPFLDEILTTAEPMMSANNNRFTLKCQAEIGEIRTDVVKLRQILINLLSNAAKFTENGDVRLQVSRFTDDAGAGGAEWIRIAVSDTGIGIAPEDLTTVFNAFERSEAGRASRYDGTGLGLAICHHYCEMLGGVISAKSNLGKGSVFSIRLPQTADDDNRAKNAATA